MIEVTQAGPQAVSLVEAKAHCHITHNSDDVLLSDVFIPAAIEYCIGLHGLVRTMPTTATLTLSLSRFSVGSINLCMGKVQSITSVTYKDTDGNASTLQPDRYALDGRKVTPDSVWPDGTDVTITFTAGYANGALPAPIKAAILLVIGDLYANRERQQDTALYENDTAINLLNRYRQWRV